MYHVECIDIRKNNALFGYSDRACLCANSMYNVSNFFIRNLMTGLKNVLGGELKGYTEMMQESRQIATQRMCKMATEMGADAVIGVRYTTSAVMPQAAEVLAYGTAVKFVN